LPIAMVVAGPAEKDVRNVQQGVNAQSVNRRLLIPAPLVLVWKRLHAFLVLGATMVPVSLVVLIAKSVKMEVPA
jgi:hypothetical protein